MIHDALLVLWDCSQGEISSTEPVLYANEGDAEIYSRICSIAKSHHRIQNFIAATSFHSRKLQTASNIRNFGLYGQAMSEGITEVLQSYKKELVKVEKLVIGNKDYTLTFVYSYVEKFHGLFNTINMIIGSIKERRLSGCEILSLTHQNILNGNEMVHNAMLRIFSCINNVFINQLCTWLLYGELKDPYEEFFIYRSKKDDVSETVLSSPSNSNTCDKTLVTTLQQTSLDCGYNINASMIPYFMPLSLAQEILFIGKTVILFGFDPRKVKRSSIMLNSTLMPLHKLDYDSRRFTIWEEKESEFHNKLQQLKEPEVFEVYNLRCVVREIKECVTKHLWTVAVEEAHLLHELRLMKDFYLLGRGELFLELLRLTAHILDKPTTRTSTRDMNHAFQLAARAVFLSNSADIDKFSFELPYVKPIADATANSSLDDDSSVELSSRHIFFVYKIRGQTNSVNTEEINDAHGHQQISNTIYSYSPESKVAHVLQILKFYLNPFSSLDGWSAIILKYDFKWPLHLLFAPEVLARYNDMFRLLLRIKKTQHDLHALWKTYKQSRRFAVCQLHNKLMFLMDNLQHYLQADVLESNFSRLMDAVNKTNDFEKLKEAHATFLADILSQSFLTTTTSERSEGDPSGDGVDTITNPVFVNIMDLLKLCDSFCSMSELASDREAEDYYIKGYSDRFNKVVKQLTQLLVCLRERACGAYLARLLMRLDYNRWLSAEAELTRSLTHMLRC